MPKFKNIKKNIMVVLAVLITIGPILAFAENDKTGEDYGNLRHEEELNSLDDVEFLDDTLDPRFDGQSLGGPIEYEAIPEGPQTFAAPAGGPHVGQLSKVPRSTATTVDIFTTANLSSKITYLENGMNSGVFPILDQSGNSYKIALAGVIGWVDKKFVDIYQYGNTANGYDYYQVKDGRLYHYIGQGVNSGKSSIGIDQGPAPKFLGTGQYISYDSHYFYDCTVVGLNKLIADYNSGSRKNSVNPNEPFYNYFMWLPARTQTKITDKDLRNFLVSRGYNSTSKSRLFETEELFINNGERYAGNAALAFSTAIHESGWGTSSFARNRNNYFGHAAYDSAPGMATAYLDPDEGISFHFGTYWSWRYLYPEGRNKGGVVGNKGVGMNVDYASDPYWGEKIAAHYYNLDRASGNKDYGRYTIGVFTDSGVNIRKEPTTGSASVYKSTRVGMPVAIIENRNNWYGFTSDLIMDANKNEPPAVPFTPMKISTSTVYASSDYIQIVHKGKDSKLLPQRNIPMPTKPTLDKTLKTYVTKGTVSLRPNASTTYSPVLTIPANTTIKGYQSNTGWVQLVHSGNIGFASLQEINNGGGVTPPEPNLPKPGNKKLRTTDRVNMRSTPVTGSVIITVPLHGHVTVGEPVDGWVHAKYNNLSGYMSAAYLEDIPSTTPPETKPPVKPTYPVGDVNGDGKVNSLDYMIIKNYIMGKRNLSNDEKVRADVNKDGRINSQDYMRIKNMIMGR